MRSSLKYFLTRRYAAERESELQTGTSAGTARDARSEEHQPLTLAERQAFCLKYNLGDYRGGEVAALSGDSKEGGAAADKERLSVAESLLKAAFVCVCLREEAFLVPLMEDVATCVVLTLTFVFPPHLWPEAKGTYFVLAFYL